MWHAMLQWAQMLLGGLLTAMVDMLQTLPAAEPDPACLTSPVGPGQPCQALGVPVAICPDCVIELRCCSIIRAGFNVCFQLEGAPKERALSADALPRGPWSEG